MKPAWTLRFLDHNVGQLSFDLPDSKVNLLSARSLYELTEKLTELETLQLQALIIRSDKPDSFIAGADINEIQTVRDEADGQRKAVLGQRLFQRIAALPYPTLAAIHGACLGGGLELALACSYRFASKHPKTILGLPEVSLGIIPGFGGTQRLPRLVGLRASLKMILSGKPVDPKRAVRIGLVDRCCPREFLDEQAQAFCQDICLPNRKQARPFDPWPWRQVVYHSARRNLIAKTKGQYPAPLAALDVVQHTFRHPLELGLAYEAEAFAKLAVGNHCKNLVHLYQVRENLRKDKGVAEPVPPHPIGRTAVVGAGAMGSGITWALARAGHPVRLKDLDWKRLGRGHAVIADYFQQLRKIHKMNQREINQAMHRIRGATDFQGFQAVDLVVEAVLENQQLKQKVLQEIEAAVTPDCIIASNTSTLSISQLSTAMTHPERFIGMHFFNPVNRMQLIEVIPGDQTSADTIAAVVAQTKALGKTPVVVHSSPGFLVNRLLLPYLNESVQMLAEGADPSHLDAVLRDFGMPMGPLRLIDEVGFDVAWEAGNVLAEAFGPRMSLSEFLHYLYHDQHLLGKKSALGFYRHDHHPAAPNPDLDNLVLTFREKTHLQCHAVSDTEILDRAVLRIINEAARCLQEGVVARPDYLDMAMILGTGFPPFLGGPMRYADAVGLPKIVSRLKWLADRYGPRFEPSPMLIEMARANRRFYAS